MKLLELASLPLEPASHDAHVLKRVMLRNGQVPNLTNFSQSSIPAGTRTTSHAHTDMTEIFFIISGTGEIIINDQAQPIGPGSCVVIEYNETHVLHNTGTEPLVLNYFGLVES
jgi:mannose-6-phosphate isomerase-like protein (cupin superfamily)